MAYKYSDPEKWGDMKFQELSVHAKLLMLYLIDISDNAGFVPVDEDRYKRDLGMSREVIRRCFKEIEGVYLLSKDKRYIWLKGYLALQRCLPLSKKSPAHKSIIETLEHHFANEETFRDVEGSELIMSALKKRRKSKKAKSSKPSKRRTKEQVERDNARARRSLVKPTPEEVSAYLQSHGVHVEQAEKTGFTFVKHYESNGWMVGRNVMRNWKSAADGWLTRLNDSRTKSAKKIENLQKAHESTQNVDWNKVKDD